MIYKICCMFSMVASAPVFALCLDKMLTPDDKKASRTRRLLFWTGSYILIAMAKIMLTSSIGLLAASVIYIIGTVLILRYCYQESMLEKTIAWIILVAFTILSDGISSGIYYLICGERIKVDYSAPRTALGCVIGWFIIVPMYGIAVRIWDKGYKKRNVTGNTGVFLLLCLVPVCILIMGAQVLIYSSDSSMMPYLMAYSILAIMAILMIFVLLIQHDRAAAQKELAETLRRSELERAHYAAVEEKREILARIRHDYRNVLNAALILMEGGSQQKAKQLLTELTERIEATSEYPFCAVPVINAVLTEKKDNLRRTGDPLAAEASASGSAAGG